MEQLILHLLGDYVLQSHTMAIRKVQSSFWCLLHTILYTLPFLILTKSVTSLLIIGITHFLIDRFRLAKYLVWLKNLISSPKEIKISLIDALENGISSSGFPRGTPDYIALWLLIIVDNFLHMAINFISLKYF